MLSVHIDLPGRTLTLTSALTTLAVHPPAGGHRVLPDSLQPSLRLSPPLDWFCRLHGGDGDLRRARPLRNKAWGLGHLQYHGPRYASSAFQLQLRVSLCVFRSDPRHLCRAVLGKGIPSATCSQWQDSHTMTNSRNYGEK